MPHIGHERTSGTRDLGEMRRQIPQQRPHCSRCAIRCRSSDRDSRSRAGYDVSDAHRAGCQPGQQQGGRGV